MSTISERKKDGKVIAFKFLACLGRDADGKRICKGTTWRPPEGLSYTKARKLAEAEAYRWEQELRIHHLNNISGHLPAAYTITHLVACFIPRPVLKWYQKPAGFSADNIAQFCPVVQEAVMRKRKSEAPFQPAARNGRCADPGPGEILPAKCPGRTGQGALFRTGYPDWQHRG